MRTAVPTDPCCQALPARPTSCSAPSGFPRTSTSTPPAPPVRRRVNIYANKKNRRYNKIITEKSLDLNYASFIVESFGAFASDTWKFINTVCDPNTHPNANDKYNPWNNPAPLRAFTLATSFANQRGNAVMLLEANSRRRSQRANHRHASG